MPFSVVKIFLKDFTIELCEEALIFIGHCKVEFVCPSSYGGPGGSTRP